MTNSSLLSGLRTVLPELLARLGGMRPITTNSSSDGRVIFVATGLVMLVTATAASFSASFAVLSTGLAPALPIGLLFGAFWGAAILAIDWLLVVSMKRHPAGGWRNVVQSTALLLPRIAVAVVIGTVMSEPLILQLFQPEIAAQVQVDIAKQKADAMKQLDQEYQDIPVMEAQVKDLQATIASADFYDPAKVNPAYDAARKAMNAAEKACDDANRAAEREAAGNSGTRQSGYGPEWRRLNDIAKGKCASFAQATAAFNQIAQDTASQHDASASKTKQAAQAELDRLTDPTTGPLVLRRAQQAAEAKVINEAAARSDGLLARLRALNNLGANPAIGTAHLFVMLLLCALEVLPVLTKWLRTVGSPDAHYEAEQAHDAGVIAAAEVQGRELELAAQSESAIRSAERIEAERAAAIRARIQVVSAKDWLAKQQAVEAELNSAAIAFSREIELERLQEWKRAELARHAQAIAAARSAHSAPAPILPHVAPQQALGLQAP